MSISPCTIFAHAPDHLQPEVRPARSLTGEFIELIAPLDTHGQSRCCRPIQKQRVIDLREGDFIWHRGRSYIIDGVQAYRDARVDQQRLEEQAPTEGYVVRGS